jgi:NADP-dependent aldehyde dehydrogenase
MTTTQSTDLGSITTAATEAAPLFASMALEDRAALLERIAGNLEAAREELLPLAHAETSLAEARLAGELARTTGQLNLFASVLRDGAYLEVTIDHADPGATPPRPDLRRWLEPLGPVAVFTASNFPFAFSVAGGDTASALAAGCPVVVKGHSGHVELSRRTAQIVAESVQEHGLPAGVFAHVEGRETGVRLVREPAIKAAGFTGSIAAGRRLFDIAVGRPDPIPFYGELSSINPVVISPGAADARASTIAEQLLASVTLGVGQFCTKPGLIFVPTADDLTAQIAQLMGSGAQPGPAKMLNQGILDSFTDGLRNLCSLTGLDIVAGEMTGPGATGATPLVLVTDADGFRANRETLSEECFGPTCVLVRYASSDELIDLLSHLPGALAGCLHVEDSEPFLRSGAFEALRSKVGRVVLNGWPTGLAVSWSMNHGGPWPATTNAMHTSVGATSIRRFLRPVTYQDVAADLLPVALQEGNPLQVLRRVDGRLEAPAST